MDGEDTAWLVVLEKKGLHQATEILESYGIDSETDVSLLDQDDFSKLASNGLKPMEGKKLERWCTSVHAPAQNMQLARAPSAGSDSDNMPVSPVRNSSARSTPIAIGIPRFSLSICHHRDQS